MDIPLVDTIITRKRKRKIKDNFKPKKFKKLSTMLIPSFSEKKNSDIKFNLPVWTEDEDELIITTIYNGFGWDYLENLLQVLYPERNRTVEQLFSRYGELLKNSDKIDREPDCIIVDSEREPNYDGNHSSTLPLSCSIPTILKKKKTY